jgi:hypothetical protein
VPKQTYQQKLDAAKRGREKVLQRMAADREILSREDAIISLLTAHVEVGPGHVLMPDPQLASWAGRTEPAWPDCRLCGVTIASTAGKQPCPGDTRLCPAPVETASETTYRRYQQDGYRCGASGTYSADFLSWTCTGGHETRLIQAYRHGPKGCTHDPSPGRQASCLGDCPSRGLDVTIIEPAPAGFGRS